MSDRLVQIGLDREQYRCLALEARRRGVSIPDLIRDAIARAHPTDVATRRREAMDAILAAEPAPVPDDPRDLRRELDEARSRNR